MAGVNNQNTQQPRKKPVTIGGYPEAVHDLMRAKYPDYDQVMNGGNQVMQGGPQGGIPAVAPQPMNMNVFQQNGGASGKFEAPAVMPEPDFTPDTPAPAPEYGTDGVQFTNPAQTQQNDLSSLSSALTGAGVSRQVPEFEADPKQRDGGFFSWLGKVMPKSRPGMREGETPEEYDRRITTNRENIAAFADAIRHMGNIINTSKGAPLQVFNDPTAMMEQGYQNRKAQRQKQAALDADSAYKQANLDLDNRKAQADQVYKEYLMGLRGEGNQLAKDKFEYRKGKDAAADQYKKDKDDRDFKYKKERDKVKDEQARQRLAIQKYNATHKGRSGGGRSGKGGSGSGGKYWFEDKNGKMRYQPNKTMWEQEYYREYGKLPQGETTTSTSTKSINPKTGAEVTTTTRRKGASVTSQAAASQNAARNARNRPKPAGKSKNGYKNTKKLGL